MTHPLPESLPELPEPLTFEEWWERTGQYSRAGGGGYEKTFAYYAWHAALAGAGGQEKPQSHSVGAPNGAAPLPAVMTDGGIDEAIAKLRFLADPKWYPALAPILPFVERLLWLHSSGSNDVDGYEWGIYRVKWINGRAAEVWQTNADFSDLDAAMNQAAAPTETEPGADEQ